jgi:hypothetical protein
MCIRDHTYKWLQNIRLVGNNYTSSNEWIFGGVGLLFSLARNSDVTLEKCIGFLAGKQVSSIHSIIAFLLNNRKLCK